MPAEWSTAVDDLPHLARLAAQTLIAVLNGRHEVVGFLDTFAIRARGPRQFREVRIAVKTAEREIVLP